MPTVLCPRCTKATTLPDPWPHPGYTCPHCGAVVSLAPAPSPPPPPAPAAPVQIVYRDATPAGGTTARAFGSAFGGSMGCLAAMFLVFVAVLAFCMGGFSGSTTRR